MLDASRQYSSSSPCRRHAVSRIQEQEEEVDDCMRLQWAEQSPAHSKLIYLIFFPATIIGDFPEFELAVADTFGLTCFGFFASLLPRLLSPLDICFSLCFKFKNLYKHNAYRALPLGAVQVHQ